MNEISVSVIIPSFNRAHLLPQVIPSYIQDYVCEIIIIDDNSTDDTELVVNELITKFPLIRYFKSSKKIRQTGAKNIGIKLAKGSYFYFGDDDSILKVGSIKSLLQTSYMYPDSIIACRHIYMKESDKLEEVLADSEVIAFENISQIYKANTINIDLSKRFKTVIEIPFCTYCFLIPKSIIQGSDFYEGFIKTCFREETDFIMQICQRGSKVYLDNFALSVDLPRIISKGGIYSVKFIERHLGEVYNEYLFYKRNKLYLKKISSLNTNEFIRAMVHFNNKTFKYLASLFIKKIFKSL